MKTFLKVLLGVLGVMIAIRLLPRIIGLGMAVVGMAVGLMSAVVGLGTAIVAGALGMATILAPLWMPVALIVGAITLCRRKKEPIVVTPIA